jgi:hypothetical protein
MPAPRTTIELKVPDRGTHTVTSAALSVAIAKYLPASPLQLWAIIAERTGTEPTDPQVRGLDIAACLVMLADFDYNVDDSPLRNY